jgi:hypothetical protein
MIEEKIVRVFYRSFWYYFFSFLASLIILLGAFFFIIPLFRFGWWGRLIFWFLIALSFLYGLTIIIKWRGNKLIITANQVIIVLQIGVLTQKLFKISYEKISQVNVLLRGLWSIIFRLGTIEIFIIDEKEPIRFSGLKQPEIAQELILHFQSNQQLNKEKIGQNLTQDQLIEMIRFLKRRVGRDVFRQIAEEDEE